MRLFEMMGSISHKRSWVHSQSSIVFIMLQIWLILGHWQFASCTTMSSFKVIDSFLGVGEWVHSKLSAVCLVDNVGTVRGHLQFSSCTRKAPLNVFGGSSYAKEWAHSRSPAAFLVDNVGPIGGYRPFSSCMKMGPLKVIGGFCERMGPFMIIGRFSRAREWADSRSSAVCLVENAGQICGHRQYSYEWEWAHWSSSAVFLIENAGLFVVIPVIFMQNGLIQGRVWVFLCKRMGSIKLIGRFFYVKEWAHSWTSAILFLHGNETIQAHWWFLMWENGSIQSHRQFFSYGLICDISSFLHAWEWAHSMSSVG